MLLMQDLQLMHPVPGAQFEHWESVGKRVPAPPAIDIRRGSGLQHAASIYIAVEGAIFHSLNLGDTWDKRPVHRFFTSRIACLGATCFALLSELGSEWNGLVSTALGTNDWLPFGSLDLPEIRRALDTQAKELGEVETFGACAMMPTAEGVYVGGIANAGKASWGAVLVVTENRPLRSLTGTIPGGAWELGKDQHGRLWVGGDGAFVQSANGWSQVWSAAAPK
jgi:hypothetical protein